MKNDLKQSTILITGGTGSFGQRFAEIVLREYEPKKLIVYSRDEWKQQEMRTHGFDHPNIRFFIGDVRDEDRLRRALQGVDVVVHAAALKQIPACEYNPFEAVATNIMGARHVIEAALDCRVGRVLALSTDKATSPTNLYGATKLVAEKLFVHANVYSGSTTLFSVVRYGNVVGTRGSVVPIFLEQKKTGQISITDERMTRFAISLDQSIRFVISSIERMRGGEVFVPKVPSMKVLDLAKAIAPECRMNVIGIRPGEKIHESLISPDEARLTVDLDDCYAILPTYRLETAYEWEKLGRKLPEHFSYTSDTNPDWITPEALLKMIYA